MKIRLQNTIKLDQEAEVIAEVYEGTFQQKAAFAYLSYQNDQAERVLLKFNDQELSMTRFSNPKSIMRFVEGGLAQVTLPTPMGLQQLQSKTSNYQLDLDQQTLTLSYQLRQPSSNQVLADYQLELSWG